MVQGASACKACPGGQASHTAGAEHCVRCEGGQVSASGRLWCEPCAAGTGTGPGSTPYGEGNLGLVAFIQGRVGTQASNMSNNRTHAIASEAVDATRQACSRCKPGTYSKGLVFEGGRCTACPCGRVSQAGSTGCSACAAGRYQSSAGASECLTCPRGKQALVGACRCTTSPIVVKPECAASAAASAGFSLSWARA